MSEPAMRVALSMVGLSKPRTTGLERYGIEMIRAARAHAPDDVEIVPVVHDWAAEVLGGSCIVVPRHLARPLAAEAWLPVQFARTPVDLLHVLSFAPPALGATPFVVTVHDLAAWDLPHAQSRGNRWYFRPALERSLRSPQLRAIVSHAQSTADEAARRWRLSVPARGIPIGLDDVWFPDTQLDVRPPGALRLLSVGTVEPRKGLDIVSGSVRLLHERGLDFEWRLVGRNGWGVDAPPRGVKVAGVVSDSELRSLYAWADVVVAPSLEEGFDLPVAEALASGTPVIASDIRVHRELFAPVAQLVAAGNADALADAIEIAAGRAQSACELQEERRERQAFARRFNWPTAIASLVQLWRMVV